MATVPDQESLAEQHGEHVLRQRDLELLRQLDETTLWKLRVDLVEEGYFRVVPASQLA